MKDKQEVTRAEFVQAVREFKRVHRGKLKNLLNETTNPQAAADFWANPIIRSYLARPAIKFVDTHPDLIDSTSKEKHQDTDHYELKIYKQIPDKVAYRNEFITTHKFYEDRTKIDDMNWLSLLLKESSPENKDIKIDGPHDIYEIVDAVIKPFLEKKTNDQARFYISANSKDNHASTLINVVDPESHKILVTLYMDSGDSEVFKDYFSSIKYRFFMQLGDQNAKDKLSYINVSHGLQIEPDDMNCVLYRLNFIRAIVDMLGKPEIANKAFELAKSIKSNPKAEGQLKNMFKEGLKAYLPYYYNPVGEAKSQDKLREFHMAQRWYLGGESIISQSTIEHDIQQKNHREAFFKEHFMTPKHEIAIEMVAAHADKLKENKELKLAENQQNVHLNCPDSILKAFQDIVKDSKLPGCTFNNPYTGKKETFPEQADQFTARHLQILARNEHVNVTGEMKTGLYNGLLTREQIAAVRMLVKFTTISGVTQAKRYGGYPAGAPTKEIDPKDQKCILIDQAGYQWQADFLNTGGLFFYPDSDDKQLKTKNTLFDAIFAMKRPQEPSARGLKVTWNGVKGQVDLDLVAKGIQKEFLQAMEAVAHQGNVELSVNDRINFKFLKAGMGFFADGLKTPDKALLEEARIIGIRDALLYINSLDEEHKKAFTGKIGRLELPFSASKHPSTAIHLQEIEQLAKNLNIEWGGAGPRDALEPTPGYVNALTNCADPHAKIGNEGKYGSVDAAIYTNTESSHFNADYNEAMKIRVSPDCNLKRAEQNDQQLNEIVTKLKQITKEYKDSIKDPTQDVNDVSKIVQRLDEILTEKNSSSQEKINNFYSFLDKKVISNVQSAYPATDKNIDVIKKDNSASSKKFLLGVLTVVGLCLGIVPGLLIMAINYAITGKNSLSGLQSNKQQSQEFIKHKEKFASLVKSGQTDQDHDQRESPKLK